MAIKRSDTVAKIEEIARGIGEPHGIEIVEVELKGSGRNQLLRITIDKPSGVGHTDCEIITRGVGAVLDEQDPIAASYEFEVTSPGVERKLLKWQDWQRFTGQKVKVFLREPVDNVKYLEGVIVSAVAGAQDQIVNVELPDSRTVAFPFENVDRANLRFDW